MKEKLPAPYRVWFMAAIAVLAVVLMFVYPLFFLLIFAVPVLIALRYGWNREQTVKADLGSLRQEFAETQEELLRTRNALEAADSKLKTAANNASALAIRNAELEASCPVDEKEVIRLRKELQEARQTILQQKAILDAAHNRVSSMNG